MPYLKSPDLKKKYWFNSIPTNDGIIERTPCILTVFSDRGKCVFIGSLNNLRQEFPNVLSQYKCAVNAYYHEEENSYKHDEIILSLGKEPVYFSQ